MSTLQGWHFLCRREENGIAQGVVMSDDGDTLTLFVERPVRLAEVVQKAALTGFSFFPTSEDVAAWVAVQQSEEAADEAEEAPKKRPYKPTGA